MKTNNNNKKNSAIFSTCHALTRAVIEYGENENNNNFGFENVSNLFDYRATFTACIRLYFRDFTAFLTACKNAQVSTVALAKADDEKFDIFRAFAENDESKISALLNFAYNYGRKICDCFRTVKETADDTISDNFAPKAVDNAEQDRDDIKNEIALYILDRADDAEYLRKPNLFKLTMAGDVCFHKYIFKENRRAVREVFSLDAIGDDDETANDKSAFLIDKREYYADIDKVDIIDFIVSQLPKVHREIGRKFMARYYSNRGKSGIKISDIARDFGVSERTLKSIRAEIKSIGIDAVRNRDKYAD